MYMCSEVFWGVCGSTEGSLVLLLGSADIEDCIGDLDPDLNNYRISFLNHSSI